MQNTASVWDVAMTEQCEDWFLTLADGDARRSLV